jgi:xanthine dehydrogenase accessory factor
MDELRLSSITEGPALVQAHRVLLGESVLEHMPPGAHVLIMTHDHAEDFAICDAAVRRHDLGSVGLIGSSAKWSRFRSMLTGEGHSDAEIARITCPIGGPSISGKEPAVIAISVAAELLLAFQSSANLKSPDAEFIRAE